MAEPELMARCEVYVNTSLELKADPSWVLWPHLIAESLLVGVSTTVDTATLRWRFGRLDREADLPSAAAVDGAVDWRDPAFLLGKYVRLVCASRGVDWVGFVLVEGKARGPQVEIDDGIGGTLEALADGEQLFTAVGLEWFLQRQTVNSAWVRRSDDTVLHVQRPIPFNGGYGDGRSLAYDKRENKEPGLQYFTDSPDSAELWTAQKIVEYLLSNYGPADETFADSPIGFQLAASAAPYLNWFTPTIECAGRSVWQILNDVIAAGRGLLWWLAWTEPGAAPMATIYVSSMATGPVAMPGGGTLPIALSTFADPAFDDQSLLAHPTIARDLGRRFHRVIARGARRRAVFTVSLESGNLEASWKSTEETTYRTALGADPKANDRYRQARRFERVYQCFQIPVDWNGTSNDGGSAPGGSDFACPQVPQGSLSIIGAEPIAMPGLRLLRTMPTRVGWDYEDATAPTPRDPDEVTPEFQRPFAVFDIGESGGSGPKWRFSEELSTTAEDETNAKTKKTSFHLRVLEGVAGVQLSPGSGMPHALALNHFDPVTDGATEHNPEVDFDKLRCTVCGEWDAYCEGAWPVAIPAASPVHTLYLYLGDRYRLDWLAEGTIYDAEGDTLKTVTTGGPLRDDRDRLVEIAKLAHEWYGVERAELALAVTGLPNLSWLVALGSLVTTIGSGDQLETINAVVSQIDYDFGADVMRFSCGFTELNFEALF